MKSDCGYNAPALCPQSDFIHPYFGHSTVEITKLVTTRHDNSISSEFYQISIISYFFNYLHELLPDSYGLLVFLAFEIIASGIIPKESEL